MSNFPHSLLDEYKTQAHLLFKQLRSDNQQTATIAANRFQQLSYFQDVSISELIKPDTVKLKHALHVIAYEHGNVSWADLKKEQERQVRYRAYKQKKGSAYTLLYPERCTRFTNEWHVDYEIASTELGRNGGYLLPYKNQFFICQSVYIEELGLDPDDSDWERIGWNWVQPTDQAAWERLNNQLRQLSSRENS